MEIREVGGSMRSGRCQNWQCKIFVHFFFSSPNFSDVSSKTSKTHEGCIYSRGGWVTQNCLSMMPCLSGRVCCGSRWKPPPVHLSSRQIPSIRGSWVKAAQRTPCNSDRPWPMRNDEEHEFLFGFVDWISLKRPIYRILQMQTLVGRLLCNFDKSFFFLERKSTPTKTSFLVCKFEWRVESCFSFFIINSAVVWNAACVQFQVWICARTST